MRLVIPAWIPLPRSRSQAAGRADIRCGEGRIHAKTKIAKAATAVVGCIHDT